jgi:hypothetical protein
MDSVRERCVNLRQLSVFLQGRLETFHTFGLVCYSLLEVHNELISLELMVVRFPWLAFYEWWSAENSQVVLINNALGGAVDGFRVIKQTLKPDYMDYDVLRFCYCGGSPWRVGSMYTGIDKMTGAVRHRDYGMLMYTE